MINIRSGGFQSTPTSKRANLGTNGSNKNTNFVSQSNGGMPVPGSQNTTVTGNPITLDLEPLLTGLTPELEAQYFHRLYRDMYYHDPLCGSAVDLMSMFPFSDFSMGGITNPRVQQEYEENIERLNVRTLMPDLSIDYLVLGAHISSLIFNPDSKKFVDILPHTIENTKVTPLPFYSQDPIITVTFPDDVRAAIASGSKRIERLKAMYGKTVFEKIAEGTLELDPLSTLYIPRRTFTKNDRGTSFYRRVLPIYLIEKNLMRGTLIESARRQRGILHITCGDGENWDPTLEDLNFVTELFANADSDPTGAILATKAGIVTEEIRGPGDFWKVNEFWDAINPHKLRALGISESFMSMDATYSTSDTALSVFIEMIRSYRDMITRKVFTNRVLPLISLVNGFVVSKSGKLSIRPEMFDNMDPEDAMLAMNDGSKLFIPTINWNKQLKPEGDSAYIEMLQSMGDKGIPIPLRMMAAAAGITLEDLVKHQSEDLVWRKRMQDYVDQIKKLNPPADSAEASAIDQDVVSTVLASVDPTGNSRSAVLSAGDGAGRRMGRVPLFSRDFGDGGLIADVTKTGKPKHIINQKRANERMNKRIVQSMKNNRLI